MSFEYNECVPVHLVTSSLCRIILLSVTSLAVPCLSTLSYKKYDFLKNIEHKICALSFFTNFSKFFLF